MIKDSIEKLGKLYSLPLTHLLSGKYIKITKYLTPAMVVKLTRVLFHKKIDHRCKISEFRLTIGKPNYKERKFIELCKKAGEKFPVKKVQLVPYKYYEKGV